jgi:acetyl/propionyl-CoA carboxylase alpha subunit
MEMNTRLQVEHPVTELITGLDLVELQLRVACGGKLPAQREIRLNGHAVEGRLCAEDPARGFLPSSGLLEAFDLSAFAADPGGGATLRLDSAVEEGDIVPATYDSMIAKAIAHAPTRDAALDALGQGLREAEVWPVATNAALLANLLDDSDVREGVATTNLVEARLNELAVPEDAEVVDGLVLGAIGIQALHTGLSDPWDIGDGFRGNSPAQSTFVFDIGGEAQVVKLTRDDDGVERAHIGENVYEVDVTAAEIHQGVIVSGAVDGADVMGVVRMLADGPVLFMKGRAMALRRPQYSHALESLEAGDDIRAPMPGKILEVNAVAGRDVRKGDPLVVMEAMKMEHTLAAPRDGKIIEVSASPGTQTSEGAVLVKLEPQPE